MMESPLKLLSTLKEQWKSLLKPLAFGLGLALAALTETLLGAAPFFVVAIILYVYHRNRLKPFTASFSVLAIFSFIALDLVSQMSIGTAVFSWLTVLISFSAALGVWLLLNLKSFLRSQNIPFYSLLNTGLMVLVLASLLGLSNSFAMSLLAPLMFTALGLLLFEFFRARNFKGKRVYISAFVIALLATQMGYLFRFAALSSVGVAVVLSLFTSLSRDLFVSHMQGKLDLALVMRQFTVLVLLSLVVFAASNI